jgi:hypothetical protein
VGQAGWIRTANLGFFGAFGFICSWVSFVLPAAGTLYRVLREREPLVRQAQLGVSCKVQVLTE